MSDAHLAEQIARDTRLQAVRLGIDVDADFREGRPLAAIYSGFKRDAELALLEFAEADLGDMRKVMDLQARVYILLILVAGIAPTPAVGMAGSLCPLAGAILILIVVAPVLVPVLVTA